MKKTPPVVDNKLKLNQAEEIRFLRKIVDITSEDLDLGFRGWQRDWPTVFAAGARVEHRHRSTTSRYYTEDQLSRVLEVNLLKFIAGTVTSPAVFKKLWHRTLHRLNLRAATQKGDPAAFDAITLAARSGVDWIRPAPPNCADAL